MARHSLPLDMHKLYVDHIVTELEKKSIGEILDLFVMYCGVEEMLDYLNCVQAAHQNVRSALLTPCPYCKREHDGRLACSEYAEVVKSLT